MVVQVGFIATQWLNKQGIWLFIQWLHCRPVSEQTRYVVGCRKGHLITADDLHVTIATTLLPTFSLGL